MRRAVLFSCFLLITGCAGLAAGWGLHPKPPATGVLPVMARVPQYTLQNQLGRMVSSQAFAGKVRVVTFLFPYCRDYCPQIALHLVHLERALKTSKMADRVQLISFNVDPKGTGPVQMRAFQQQYGWNPEDTAWQYLTGPPEEIRHIVSDGYHIYYEKIDTEKDERQKTDRPSRRKPVPNRLAQRAGVEYDIVHNDAMIIVDADGRIRAIFDDADRVPIRSLLDVIEQLLPGTTAGY